jgi:exodeoxyribonuclease VII large subunit
MSQEALSVSEVLRQVKTLLEDRFEGVWIAGELGNVTRPRSGHVYLTIKDDHAAVKGVMFRYAAQRLKFEPREGEQVLAFGTLTLYEPRGDFQVRLTQLVPQGLGKLQQAFEKLRAQLEAEGLFAPGRKRPLPALPRRLALVTSPTGAAVHDMLRVLGRRWPGLDVVVVPTRVQGKGAEQEIAAALDRADDLGVDLILCGRGGGSLEDLWAFNEEATARAIFRCRTPVVSAVGHEVDTTIADLVADLRAPTPSAAAELAVPEKSELTRRVLRLQERLVAAARARLERAGQRLDRAAGSRVLRHPFAMLEPKAQRVDELAARLGFATRTRSGRLRDRMEALAARLEAVGPQRVLARGFSLLTRPGEAVPVRRATDLDPGDTLEARLGEGGLELQVTAVHPEGLGRGKARRAKKKSRARGPRKKKTKAPHPDQKTLFPNPQEESP